MGKTVGANVVEKRLKTARKGVTHLPQRASGSWRRFADWFLGAQRAMPWRDDPGFYKVWISEIMLQQTQVAAVIPFFERFMSRFPTVETLAHADEEEVLKHWAGLGYYSRARNLRRAAQAIVSMGGFPTSTQGWQALPGIGPYTAGAIVSIVLEKPAAIVDGNVERVLSRLWRIADPGPSKRRIWRLSGGLVRRALAQHGISPRVFNQALMELGATVCTPRSPRCGDCPLSAHCRALRQGDAEAFPARTGMSKKWVRVEEKADWILDSQNRLCMRLRKTGEWLSGLWDLVEPAPAQALSSAQARLLGEVSVDYVITRHKIARRTRVWTLPCAGLLQVSEHLPGSSGADLRWVPIGELQRLPVGAGFKRTLSLIRERYPEAFPEN